MGKWLLGVLLATVTLALGACATGGGAASKPAAGGSSGGQEITVRTLDTMRFEPAMIRLSANTAARLTLDNTRQALIHDLTIDNLGGQRVQIIVQPGQRASGQLPASAPGTYNFYCSQPGHKEAGMVGTLTIN
jgi:uncharacterized cupredoxin-like copper-binding protein